MGKTCKAVCTIYRIPEGAWTCVNGNEQKQAVAAKEVGERVERRELQPR